MLIFWVRVIALGYNKVYSQTLSLNNLIIGFSTSFYIYNNIILKKNKNISGLFHGLRQSPLSLGGDLVQSPVRLWLPCFVLHSIYYPVPANSLVHIEVDIRKGISWGTATYFDNGINSHKSDMSAMSMVFAQEMFTTMTHELTDMWPLISRKGKQTYSNCHKLLQQFFQMAQRL